MTDENGNTCTDGRINSRLANLNYLQENYHIAAYFFMQVYHNNLDCELDEKKFGEIQGALNNAGSSYLHLKMTDSAMSCFKTSLKFVQQNENLFPNLKSFTSAAKGVIYQSIGNVYIENGNNKQAEFYLKKSINFNQKNKLGTTNGQRAMIKLARL